VVAVTVSNALYSPAKCVLQPLPLAPVFRSWCWCQWCWPNCH